MLRYATIGIGEPPLVAVEAAAFLLFTGVAFGGALFALKRKERWKALLFIWPLSSCSRSQADT